jgi:hypothetical protein
LTGLEKFKAIYVKVLLPKIAGAMLNQRHANNEDDQAGQTQ